MVHLPKTSAAAALLLAGFVIGAAGSAWAQSAPAAATPDDTRGGWRSACHADVKQHCRRVVGGAAKRLCLDANLSKVSAPCQAALGARRQQRAEARRACTTELQSLCKEVTGGSGDKLRCLQQKSAQVGPACGTALSVLSLGASKSKDGAKK